MSALLVAVALAHVAPVTVRCGAVERPAVALRGVDGVWRGRAVDICAAAAKAAFGPTAHIAFHGYDAGLAEAKDDSIAFLSAAEVAAAPLQGAMLAGPVMAYAKQILLVPAISARQRAKELAGHLVCFMVGSAAEDALDAWALRDAVPIERLGFQEPDEMHDAYASGKCTAMVVDQAEEASAPKLASSGNRPLGAPLANEPIIAAVPVGAEPSWQAIVADVATVGL
ncbi:hypothetical protein [Sphingomonas sp. UYP23]